jgi:hypothetical protein
MEFFGEFIAGAMLLVVSGVGAYVLNYFRIKKQEILNNSQDIAELQDQVTLLKRVFIMVAKRLDKGSRTYHDDYNTAYEELVKDLLTDELLGGNKSAV